MKRHAQVKKWVPVPALGSYVGRTWRGDLVVAPMYTDGTRSTDRLEWTVLDKKEYPEEQAAYEAALKIACTCPDKVDRRYFFEPERLTKGTHHRSWCPMYAADAPVAP